MPKSYPVSEIKLEKCQLYETLPNLDIVDLNSIINNYTTQYYYSQQRYNI